MIGKTISHYKILEKLGEGGMGVVYKAQDTKLKRPVALKFLPPELTRDKTAKERFIHEAQAASALDHANICNIHEIDETEEGQMHIVMACYEGEILKDKIESGPLKLEEAIDIAIQIAKGLEKAHKKEIIHRDIKPANILITEDGVVKILDFGLAKLAGLSQLTKTGTTLGTVSYMSPEQAKGENVDHRTDIWSFGVVLYEMLTGEKPFKGEYEQAVIYSVLNEDPDPVEKYNNDIPDYLVKAIKKALEKNPDKRFQSISEINESIKKHKVPDGSLKKEAVSEKHNLPQRLTTFIGRENEISKIKQFLSEHRLVTLTGAGGCGKTRLAIQTASELIDQYSDGVWFVDFAPLTDPKLLVNEVADVLKIKEEPNVPMIETLIERMKDKKTLIILDNCEHLISAISELSEKLLKSVPGLTFLVTSREALNISGELAWRVPSLSLPDIDKLPQIDKLDQYESVQLFTDRAKNCQPSFELSEQNGENVTRICFRLDGIPLAIELAAARIKMFDVNAILDRLDDRFRLLTGGARTALERHKTLKATIDWSYDLLTEKEKTLFNRLSVFVGGCTIEAAETICGIKPLDNTNIVDLFSSLIEKSLVVTDITQENTYWYRLLETLRHYAREKLAASGEADSIRKSHFQYYLDMAGQAYEEQFDSGLKWLNKLEQEHDNLIAALNWSFTQSVEGFVLLSGYLAWFWRSHSHIRLAEDYLEKALQKDVKKSEGYARALCGLGMLQWYVEGGDLEKRKKLMNESLGIWRRLSNLREEAIVLSSLSAMLPGAGEFEAGMKGSTKSLEIARKVGSPGFINHCLTSVCQAYTHSKQFDKAKPLVEELIDSSEKLGHVWGIECARHFLADCALGVENFKEAEKKYAHAIETNLKYGFTWLAAVDLQGVAFALSGQSRCAKSIRLDSAAREKVKSIGGKIDGIAQFWDEWIKTYLEGARKQVGEELTRQYEEIGKNMGFEAAVKYALDFDKD